MIWREPRRSRVVLLGFVAKNVFNVINIKLKNGGDNEPTLDYYTCSAVISASFGILCAWLLSKMRSAEEAS